MLIDIDIDSVLWVYRIEQPWCTPCRPPKNTYLQFLSDFREFLVRKVASELYIAKTSQWATRQWRWHHPACIILTQYLHATDGQTEMLQLTQCSLELLAVKTIFVVDLCTAVQKTPTKCLEDFCQTVIRSVHGLLVFVSCLGFCHL